HVREQVEPEAEPRHDAELEEAGRHARIADRAQEDRAPAADLVERAVGEHFLRLEIVLGAEGIGGRVHAEALDRGHAAEDPRPLAHALGPDAVARNHRDLVDAAHFAPSGWRTYSTDAHARCGLSNFLAATNRHRPT